MKKRLLSIVLALVLSLGVFSTIAMAQPIEVENPFTDVSDGAYYHDAVLWALYANVTKGTSTTTFSPTDTCTRGQVVTFLWRALGCPEPKTTLNKFTDVKTKDYFYKPVQWAVENGITMGTSLTTFSPNEKCKSCQVITFLWRANGEPEATDENTLAETYPSTYYTKALAWADTNGTLEGTGDFVPMDDSPRANIVTYLYRNAGSPEIIEAVAPTPITGSYVLNTNSHIFHYSNCASVKRMASHNRRDFTGTRDEIIAMGYEPCKNCKP